MPFGFSFEEAILLIAILLPIVLSVYCALRVICSRDLVLLGKVIWIVMLLIPYIGPLCYFLVQYRKDGAVPR